MIKVTHIVLFPLDSLYIEINTINIFKSTINNAKHSFTISFACNIFAIELIIKQVPINIEYATSIYLTFTFYI